MNLYLKINRPEGKRFNLVGPGGKFISRNGIKVNYFLYPDNPTNVPDADAKKLLLQDPHLISDSKPDFSKAFPVTSDELKSELKQLQTDFSYCSKEKSTLSKKNTALEKAIEDLTVALSNQDTRVAELKNENAELKAVVRKQSEAGTKSK